MFASFIAFTVSHFRSWRRLNISLSGFAVTFVSTAEMMMDQQTRKKGLERNMAQELYQKMLQHGTVVKTIELTPLHIL